MKTSSAPASTRSGRTRTGSLIAIAVSVDAIAEVTGTIRIALYSTAGNYAAQEPIAATAAAVTGTTLKVSLGDFPDGNYAVMLYHDVNGNEELDRNLFGLPREPWSGSLTRQTFGPPRWEDVQFELEGADVELALSL